MRVKFYIQGSEPGRQGTVHLEVKEVRGPGRGGRAGSRRQKSQLEMCLFFRTQRVASMNFGTYLSNSSPSPELSSSKIIDPEAVAGPRPARLLGGGAGAGADPQLCSPRLPRVCGLRHDRV